jgi:hypothetical protein
VASVVMSESQNFKISTSIYIDDETDSTIQILTMMADERKGHLNIQGSAILYRSLGWLRKHAPAFSCYSVDLALDLHLLLNVPDM